MSRTVSLRDVTVEERTTVERLAHSRTAASRLVERARVVLAALDGERVTASAERCHVTAAPVQLWLQRFHDGGLAGREDQPRKGRPPTDTREPAGVVVATALTDPQTVGLACASWTLDRLAAYLAAHTGLTLQRSRSAARRIAEGLRWRKHEPWLGERVDPACAAKRGPASASTPLLPPAVPSSVATRWVRKRPRRARATRSAT